MECYDPKLRERYQAMPKKEKEKIDKIAKEHPNWSLNQVFAKYNLDIETDKIIGGGGVDVNPSDPAFLKEILKKVRDFFKEIGSSFTQVIDNAINKLEDLIKQGVDKVVDKVKDILSYIF